MTALRNVLGPRCWATLLLLVSAGVSADYRWDTQLDYSELDNNGLDTESVGLTAAYYFETVQLGRGPWREAGFLARTSSVGISAQRAEADVLFATVGPTGVIQERFDDETRRVAIRGRYVLPNRRWFLAAGVSQIRQDTDVPGAPEADGTGIDLAGGWYVTPATALSLFVLREQRDGGGILRNDCETIGSLLGLCVASVRSAVDIESLRYGVQAKHVGRVFGQHYAVAASYGRSDAETDSRTRVEFAAAPGLPVPDPIDFESQFDTGPNDFVEAELDWYPRPWLRIGIGAAYTEADGAAGNDEHLFGYGIEAEWFLRRWIALGLSAVRSEPPFSELDDLETIGVHLRVRI